MSDFVIGSIVLVVFIVLAYNLLIKKKPDCHSSPSCAGCGEAKHACDACLHTSPETLKEELRKMLHNG
jgi:hypothetical protein